MPVKLPSLADQPEFPSVLDYLWNWFQEISMGLAPNGFGPPTITWDNLRAWQELSQVGQIEPWEARTLVQLGMLRAGIAAEKNEAASRTDRNPPQSSFGSGAGNGAASRRGMSLPRHH